MGARRTHYIAPDADPPAVVCVRCLDRDAHAHAYPACPEEWHDMHAHELISATRAAVSTYTVGVAAVLRRGAQPAPAADDVAGPATVTRRRVGTARVWVVECSACGWVIHGEAYPTARQAREHDCPKAGTRTMTDTTDARTAPAVPPPSRLAYSVTEAARAIGVSDQTIYREVAAGRLAAKRIRGRLIIPAPVLTEWLQAL
jgi:excisionase family DNA binding protein